MRLLQVEFTRLRWRRAVVVLLAACVLVPAAVFVGLAWNTRPFSESDVAAAQAQVDDEATQPYVARELKRCLNHPDNYGVDAADPDLQARCEESVLPQLEWYLYRPQLDVSEQRQGTGVAVLTMLVGLMMLVGTTFVGHDWASGSMSNQLLFEPRRLRVWWAKAAVVTLTGLVVSAAVLAAFWAGVGVLAASRDISTTSHQWELILHWSLRGSLLVGLASLGGYALTMLFRSTVATLGVLFAFSVGGSLLIVAIIGQNAERWLLPTNFLAVLANGYNYYSGACNSDGSDCMRTLDLADGALYLGVLLAVALVLSVLSFRTRDVP